MAISEYVAAAIAGNFKVESTVNPGVWESLIPMAWDYQYDFNDPGKGGYGLGQWTNVGSQYGRLYNLHTWVTANGYADGDGNGQMAYIPVENVWYSAASAMGFSTLSDFLSSTSTNLAGLTKEWMMCWEGLPANHLSLTDRQDAAVIFLPEIQAHAADDPNTYNWVSSNAYLPYGDLLYNKGMINNAMCIYFALNGWQPGPPLGTLTNEELALMAWLRKRRKWWIT